MVTADPTADLFDPGACLVQPRHQAADGYRTCDPCNTMARDALDDIVRLYPRVAEEALIGTGPADDGPRGATIYQSGPPINLARYDRAKRLGEAEVLDVLTYWANGVRESTGLPRVRPTLAGDATVLVTMWSWIRRQEQVGDFARALFELRRTVVQLASEIRGRIPLGQCPTPVDTDPRTGAVIRCEYRLHARPDDRVVRCPQCATMWPAYRWDELADAQEAAR